MLSVLDKTEIIDNFHRLFFKSEVVFTNTWKGIPILKNPLDLFIFQEIIHYTRPSVIIETGTFCGGSALYLESVSESDCRIVSIDINPIRRPGRRKIDYIVGSSVDKDTLNKVEEIITNVNNPRVMVFLDSCHNKDHVIQELNIYSKMITAGCYLIVEDTNSSMVEPEQFPDGGPKEAVEEWLPNHPEFTVDKTCEKFMLTYNTYLLKEN